MKNPSLNCPFCGSPECSANCDEITSVRAKWKSRIQELNSVSEFSLNIKKV